LEPGVTAFHDAVFVHIQQDYVFMCEIQLGHERHETWHVSSSKTLLELVIDWEVITVCTIDYTRILRQKQPRDSSLIKILY